MSITLLKASLLILFIGYGVDTQTLFPHGFAQKVFEPAKQA